MFHRIAAILIGLVLGLNSACSPNADSVITKIETPSDWKRFEAGPFSVAGPADLKMKPWQGIDANGYTLENTEFSFDVDISMYNTTEGRPDGSHIQKEIGKTVIDGRAVDLAVVDINIPPANAAVNADGSRSKPVEKNLLLEVRFPEELAIVSVRYSTGASTPSAIAMLQSIRRTSGS